MYQEDFLNNVLLLDIIRLLKKLVKFDVLALIQKEDIFYILLPIMFTFLEFNKSSTSLSYLISKIRRDHYKRRRKIMKSKQGLGGLGKSLISIAGNVVGGGKNLIDDIAGGAGHLLG